VHIFESELCRCDLCVCIIYIYICIYIYIYICIYILEKVPPKCHLQVLDLYGSPEGFSRDPLNLVLAEIPGTERGEG